MLCWRYIIHVSSILCWHVFCFPKKTCFIYIKITSLIQKHRSITLTWGTRLCGEGSQLLTHKGCAVYTLHFNTYMDSKPFMRQALYAASNCSIDFLTLKHTWSSVTLSLRDFNPIFIGVLLSGMKGLYKVSNHEDSVYILFASGWFYYILACIPLISNCDFPTSNESDHLSSWY